MNLTRAAVIALSAIAAFWPLAAQAGGEGLFFPLGNQVFFAGSAGPQRMGPWPGMAEPRDAYAFPGGFLAFEKNSSIVYHGSKDGLEKLGSMDAAEVFFSPHRALARGGMFENGKGFPFSLYKIDSGVKKVTTFSLDCFPSDCVFAKDQWFLAGADAGNTKNRLYEINPDTGYVRVLAELPKQRDFGRIVTDGELMWFFLSPSLPRMDRPFALRLSLKDKDPKPKRVELSGLDEGSCLYGSGFAFNGLFWVPCASPKGGSVVITMHAFDPASNAPRPLASVALATGLYDPIGESSGRFYAFGFLYIKDHKALSLLEFDRMAALRSWDLKMESAHETEKIIR